MKGFAQMRTLDLWYARQDMEGIASEWAAQASGKRFKRFERNVAKARAKDSLRAFEKLTEMVNGEPRIVSDPILVPVEELAPPGETDQINDAMGRVIDSYTRTLAGDRRRLLERFRYVHAAHKVVGVGSVGSRAWMMLLTGRDAQDPLFLQFKEAGASVLEPFLGKSKFKNHGQRVVEGQQLIQAASDVLLGWIRTPGVDGQERDFYIRQLRDGKGSALIETMDPATMEGYAELCGPDARPRPRPLR